MSLPARRSYEVPGGEGGELTLELIDTGGIRGFDCPELFQESLDLCLLSGKLVSKGVTPDIEAVAFCTERKFIVVLLEELLVYRCLLFDHIELLLLVDYVEATPTISRSTTIPPTMARAWLRLCRSGFVSAILCKFLLGLSLSVIGISLVLSEMKSPLTPLQHYATITEEHGNRGVQLWA